MLVEGHRRIALDANVLIYLLGAVEVHGPRAAAVLDATGLDGVRASLSTIGVVEALAGPAGESDAAAFENAAAELKDLELQFVPLTTDIAEAAARLRGQAGLRLADAVHMASARAAGATAFVTNDRRIPARPGVDV